MSDKHLCTDYELCPVCWLCTGCCDGHSDEMPAVQAGEE